jgi:Regulator of ribonuclease activity B/Family of unknown function (DUF695)
MNEEPAAPRDALEFYPCLVDHAPASIYVNLRYATVDARPATADTRYTVTITLRDAGAHGIGTAAEAEAVNAYEEALIARGRDVGLVYAGRVRTRGTWEITFYGPTGQISTLSRETLTDHRLDAEFERDADWRYYRDLLLPDDERRQWMDDRRLVEILREQGDVLVSPRRVDHRASFTTQAACEAYIAAAAAEGFTLAEASQDTSGDAERPFAAVVHRDDTIELDHIHDVVMILVDAATAQSGRYDGWTAAITR